MPGPFPAPFSGVVLFPAGWTFWVNLTLGLFAVFTVQFLFRFEFGSTFAEVACSFAIKTLGVLVGDNAIRQQFGNIGGGRGHWQVI